MKQQFLVFSGDQYLGPQMAGHAKRAEYLFAKKHGLDPKQLTAMDYAQGTDKLMATPSLQPIQIAN